jgi:hypothetical protein
LKERYDHQKTVILPKTRYDWLHLRLQDYKSVSEYNSAMFRITSQLLLCGEKVTDEEMLEKIYSAFHASNVLLQQQYREKGFKKYSELISCLLVVEQNNELLMKNHESRPSDSSTFPEANVMRYDNRNRGRGRGHGHGRGRGRGHGYEYGQGCGRGNYGVHFKNTARHQNMPEKEDREKGEMDKTEHPCRTTKYLVDLYQQSLQKKHKRIETNFANGNGDDTFGVGMTTFEEHGSHDTVHLDVSDFLT